VRETEGSHLTPPEFLAGENPAVAGKDSARTIDVHRDAEPEGVHAACDLPDLRSALPPRVPRIECELGDLTRDHIKLAPHMISSRSRL
jgi:hypothetical protein